MLESALALLVARVLANNADDTLPADDPAGFTQLFDGRTDFHGRMVGGERGLPYSHPPLASRKGTGEKTKTPPSKP